MGLTDALSVLARQWDEITAVLEPAESAKLTDLVGKLADEANPELSEEYGHEISDMLSRALPKGHLFRRSLAIATVRSATTRDPEVLTGWLELSESLNDRAERQAPRPRMDDVAERARRWLLDAPSRTDVAPGPHLIELAGPGGTQWPAFQFDTKGTPLPVVLEINRILDAVDDPWGVADWWLGEHHLLGDIPARLLGQVEDDLLISVALDELTEG